MQVPRFRGFGRRYSKTADGMPQHVLCRSVIELENNRLELAQMTMDPVESLLSELVAIPSMNPMGRGHTGAGYSELALAEFVRAFLSRHSIDCEMQQVIPGRPNVLGHIDVGAEKTILLEAHLDTVNAESMTIEPFSPSVREGRLYGRGSCDTKGSMAAFLQAVIGAMKTPGRLRYNIRLLFVADEEYRFTGALHAVRKGLKADCGIAGEPTQLRIVRAHKGVTRWKITTKGVAAHSAYPERGKNAIYTMSHVVNRLERYAGELYATPGHPLLGSPSLSVGVIEGGQAVNIVPDRCSIEIDRRTLPDETMQQVIDPVRSLLKDLPDWELKDPHLSVAGMEVSAGAPIVELLGHAIRDITGGVTIEAAQYATDAGIYNSAGIPTVVFGPGDIAQAHTEAEFIDLRQLAQAVVIIERVLTQ
jgi:acetylornithine deacetylase/succinyl-diaminopimelate desuccinylase family protein